MRSSSIGAVALAVLMCGVIGCGEAAAPAPAAPAAPAATSHEEFAAAACLAFDELAAVVGNPDAGTGSPMSKALDSAVSSGDVSTANRLADQSIARLEAGRRELAIAGGWEPGRAMATATDRFLLVSEVLVNGKRAGAATRDIGAGQAAFEKAGGLQAWQGMLAAAGAIQLPAGSGPTTCPNVAVQL